jgi:hypothetical protein
MKQRILIVVVLTLLLAMPAASADYMHVTRTLMEFEGADAVFTLDYELDLLAKIYVMAFGSAKIVPEIETQFASFDEDDVTVEQLDCTRAVVVVKNVSYYNKGYYFHDSHDFGITMKKLIMDPPDGSPRVYWNTNSTPSIFYADVWG